VSKGGADDKKFKILFESAPDAIYLNDLKGTFVDGNKATEKLTGYKRKELIGKSYLELKLLSKGEITKAAKSLAKNARGKPTGPDEYTINRKDGTQVAVELRTYPIKIEGKTLLLGIARDITERKDVEEALQESEERYRNIIENASDMIQSVRLDGHFEFVNRAWLETLGYTEAELPSLTIFDIIHSDSLAHCRELFQKVMAGEALAGIRATFVTKDGRQVFVEGNAAPRYLEGKVIASHGFFRDITERKCAEEELQKSAVYLDAMPDVLCVTDSSGKIVRVNQTFYDLWGYSPEEVIGRPALEMFSEGEKKKLKKEAKTAIKTGTPRHFETSILTKHGEEIPASLSETALKDEKGKATAIITVLKDITLHKKAESALRQAYDEVKSIDELKTDIISNVTHELRTPITIIRSAMEMAMHEKKPDDRAALLKMALEALARQNNIITDLIAATKIKGSRKLKIEPIDLNDVVPLVGSEFRALLIKNKLELKIDLDKNLPLVMADFEGLSHIFRNLISNAIKFNKVGKVVTVAAREKEGFVEVLVIDKGIGMPEGVRDRAFDRFYQADSSAGRQYGGIGLGLTIVKEIVELLGGEIWVKSQAGKGSTFCFTLIGAMPEA
jgi:PAS domain S-box-containing protein